MRIWYYKYIPFLPQAHLLGQWRECIAIAHDWANGTLKHAIVNRVMDYDPLELLYFSKLVADEMLRRGVHVQEYTVAKLHDYIFQIHARDPNCYNYPDELYRDWEEKIWNGSYIPETYIFEHWHNEEYARECYYNLEEKYYCGAIPQKEWERFEEGGREFV